jgi:hypothetical protein
VAGEIEADRLRYNKVREEKMKTKIAVDLYTKVVLTVIALCLIWICLTQIPLVAPLRASQTDLVDVRIKAVEREESAPWDPLAVEAASVVPTEITNEDPIGVNVTNEMVPVDVKHAVVTSTLLPGEKK